MNDYTRTTVHEAAHAVIGRAMAQTCGAVSAIADESEGENGHAICADPHRTAWDWEQREKFREFRSILIGRMLTLMAGAEAERVLLKIEPEGDGDDRAWIETMAIEAGFDDANWDRWESRLRRQCRRLVRSNRRRIERNADILGIAGTLTAESVDEVLREADEKYHAGLPRRWRTNVRGWAASNGSVALLWLFGSRAKGCATPESDVDIAVELVPADATGHWSFGNYVALHSQWRRELEEIVGRHVSFEAIAPGSRGYDEVISTGVRLWQRF